MVLEPCEGVGGVATGAQPPLDSVGLGSGACDEPDDAESTVAQPELLEDPDDGDLLAVGADRAVNAPTVAQPDFLPPRSSLAAPGPGTAPGVGVGVTRATGGFVILTPAAFASLRSSFSSRFLSFSFLLSASSC